MRLLGIRDLVEGVIAGVADAKLAKAVAVLLVALHAHDVVWLLGAAITVWLVQFLMVVIR